MRTSQVQRQLDTLRNSFVIVDSEDVCSVCGETFLPEDFVVLRGVNEKLHERCCKDKDIVVLNDLFFSVC